jgi:hypothetical protein
MNAYKGSSAGSQYTSINTVDTNLDLEMSQATYPDWQHLHNQQYQLNEYEQSPSGESPSFLEYTSIGTAN